MSSKGLIGPTGSVGRPGPIGPNGTPAEPRVEQIKLYKIIDDLYNSNWESPNISIVKIKNVHDNVYDVKFMRWGGDSKDLYIEYELSFTSSETNGIWGINKIIRVSEIISLIQSEIRDGKIDNILL